MKHQDNTNLNAQELSDDLIENVTGGTLICSYMNSEYTAAGVTVKPGLIVDSYQFNGVPIRASDANLLVRFQQENGRIAATLDEAKKWHQLRLGESMNSKGELC